MKKFSITFVLIIGLINSTFTQNLDSMQNQMKKNFEEFSKQVSENFESFRDSLDKSFTKYLDETWTMFNTLDGFEKYKKPKPTKAPEVISKKENVKGDSTTGLVIEPSKDIFTVKEPQRFAIEIKKIDSENLLKTKINFFGTEINFDYDKNLVVDVPVSGINEKYVGKYFEKMAKSNYDQLLLVLLNYKDELNLNDWAYYRLVKRIGKQIYPENKNAENLFIWFILNKSKYRVKLAYNNKQVYVLLPSVDSIYSVPRTNINGINYYLFIKNPGDISTYLKDYPGADRIFNFNLKRPVNVGSTIGQRTFNFKYKNETHHLVFDYDKSLTDFYAEYPQTEMKIYFDAAVSQTTKESIVKNLKPLLEGKTETAAANILLEFIYQCFPYKDDPEQFNKEKIMFPEEILRYPFSDCDDRSVFYAFLVKELLNKKVIGVEYPEHIATAVKFDNKTSDNLDFIKYKGEKYIVCDPTYIGGGVGSAMPGLAQLGIVDIENAERVKTNKEIIWEQVFTAGGFRGNNKQDIVFDENGDAYLTGYFTGNIDFGKFKLASENNSNDVFVAKIGKNKQFIWAKTLTGPNNDVGYGLNLDDSGFLYVTGIFNKVLHLENKEINSNKEDIFISKWDNLGRLIWLNKLGTDEIKTENNYIFYAKYDNTGQKKWCKINDNVEDFNNYSISIDNKGSCYLAGAVASSNLFKKSTSSFSSAADANIINTLKTETDKLINLKYNQGIAGLFAAINLVKNDGIAVEGKMFQMALDKYNPTFKSKCPTIYKSIGLISVVKNANGIIDIKTSDNNVAFSSMKIKNNAKIRLNLSSTGDAQVDIISGIIVGKFGINFDLNAVKLQKSTGDLLFDYGTSHTSKKFNLKHDILD